MKLIKVAIVTTLLFYIGNSIASDVKLKDITSLVSKEKFLTYKDVADFIDDSPKVTIQVESQPEDIAEYGEGVVKSLTGFDCDRDGKMDDNKTCNAVYFNLWMKYKR